MLPTTNQVRICSLGQELLLNYYFFRIFHQAAEEWNKIEIEIVTYCSQTGYQKGHRILCSHYVIAHGRKQVDLRK